MHNKLSISLLCGSNNSTSLNGQFLAWFRHHYADTHDIDLIERNDSTFPLHSLDIETDAIHESQLLRLHARLGASDCIIIASPEHNGHTSAYLKNIIDWLSRVSVFDPKKKSALGKKWIFLCSLSTGEHGGAAGLSNVRSLLTYMGAFVFPATICIPNAGSFSVDEKFCPNRFLIETIEAKIDSFVSIASHHTILKDNK